MKKLNPDIIRLQDMLQTITVIEETSRESRSRTTAFAIAYCIAVIGEAAAKTTPSLREAHPQVAWPQMIGARNRIIHEYGKLNQRILWEIVESHLPLLKTQLTDILQQLQASA